MDTLIATLKRWKELIILLAFFGAILVVPVRIYAQQFVETTVTDELTELEDKIVALQEQVAEAPTAEQLDELTDLLKQQMALLQYLARGENRRAAIEP